MELFIPLQAVSSFKLRTPAEQTSVVAGSRLFPIRTTLWTLDVLQIKVTVVLF